MDFIYKEIELMDGHIIEQCGSKRPCYCPVIAVPKPGAAQGVWRLAQDLRALNKVTIVNYVGLPDPCDLAYRLAGSFFITEFDFASGYWQTTLHKDDRYKTAFMLPDGRMY